MYVRVYCLYCGNVALPERMAGDNTLYELACSACDEPLVSLRIDSIAPTRERLSDHVPAGTAYMLYADPETGEVSIE